MSNRIELSTIARAAARRWWVVAVTTVLAVLGGFLVTQALPAVYAASSSLLVGQTTAAANVNREDILASQSVAATYADLARREPVLGEVTRELELGMSWRQLRDQVQVGVAPGNTQLVLITVRADSPALAEQINTAITDRLIALSPSGGGTEEAQFIEAQIQQVEEDIQRKQAELDEAIVQEREAATTEDARALQDRIDLLERQVTGLQNNYSSLRNLLPSGPGPNALQVLELATAPLTPVSPDLRMNLLISLVAGLVVGVGIAFWLDQRPPRRARGAAADTPAEPRGGLAVVSDSQLLADLDGMETLPAPPRRFPTSNGSAARPVPGQARPAHRPQPTPRSPEVTDRWE